MDLVVLVDILASLARRMLWGLEAFEASSDTAKYLIMALISHHSLVLRRLELRLENTIHLRLDADQSLLHRSQFLSGQCERCRGRRMHNFGGIGCGGGFSA